MRFGLLSMRRHWSPCPFFTSSNQPEHVNDDILYSTAIERYTFADGTPFGIKENTWYKR